MSVNAHASRLADELKRRNLRAVFAESCTAGLAAAMLAEVPGISEFFCGSAVTYREATKRQWLEVSPQDLEQYTAVSEPVARQMAIGALKHTPEADVATAITGHLGPDAPAELDGVVFIAVAYRGSGGTVVRKVQRAILAADERTDRQREAAELLLATLADTLCEP